MNIKFHQADPAGIMYFAHIFTLAHDCYEEFIKSCGFDWDEWFFNPTKYIVPIRHTECDFLKPLKAGETYIIEAEVIEFSSSSFKINYEFKKDQKTHANVKMVHTCLDAKTYTKIEIPIEIKYKLEQYSRKSNND